MSTNLIMLLLACTAGDADDTATPGGQSPTSACWTDLEAGQTQVLADGFTDGTEGLAFADGRLFVGTPTQVVELSPAGQPTPLWTNDHVLGIAAVGDGLWVADPGQFSLGGDTDGQLWSLSLDGAATLLSEGWSNPNFLAETPWGSVLLSDDTTDGLWELGSDGQGWLWLPDVVSPNGIVVTDHSVTVASTFVSEGEVWRATVSEGVASDLRLLANTVPGGANDGLAMGPDEHIWVAVNLAGELWRITPDGQASRFVRDLNSPASLAFGDGEGFDPCSLYVTSLFGEEVVRVVVGEG